MSEQHDAYLKIKIKGDYGSIEMEATKALFDYHMTVDKDSYNHALDGLIKVYKGLKNE